MPNNCPRHGNTMVLNDDTQMWVCSMGGCDTKEAKEIAAPSRPAVAERADEPTPPKKHMRSAPEVVREAPKAAKSKSKPEKKKHKK